MLLIIAQFNFWHNTRFIVQFHVIDKIQFHVIDRIQFHVIDIIQFHLIDRIQFHVIDLSELFGMKIVDKCYTMQLHVTYSRIFNVL